MNQGTDYSLSVTGLKCGQGVRLFRFGPLEEVASRVWVVAASLSPTTNVKFQTLKTVKFLPMRFVQKKTLTQSYGGLDSYCSEDQWMRRSR